MILILGESERHLTNDDLHALEYLECVIKESMRILPPVPFIGRKISEDCTIGITYFLIVLFN